MTPNQPLLLLVNGFSLAVSLAFLMIVLWYDLKRVVNQFFALFMLLLVVWKTGDLLYQAAALVELPLDLLQIAWGASQLGFIGSSIALYMLVTVLVGIQPKRFRLVALMGLLVVLAFNAFALLLTSTPGTLRAQSTTTLFYAIFGTITVFLVWRYRRKVRSPSLYAGVLCFVAGQGVGFLNPDLGLTTLSTPLSAFGALLISFSVVHIEMIRPLTSRDSQLESMYEISLAITSRIAADSVLDEIVVRRAVEWLEADAAAIFVNRGHELELSVLYNLPEQVRHLRLPIGFGMAGKAVQERKALFVQNFAAEWREPAEFDFARETFGSVICAPMIYDDKVIGTLMVIAGSRGRLFGQEDVRLLELLATQTAVALSHSQLFNAERQLTLQVASAHEQLKAVLESTENPVLAFDRGLCLVFSNPAAEKLLNLPHQAQGAHITQLISSNALPDSYLQVVRQLRRAQDYVYEVTHDGRVYFCHIATLGHRRIEGWVAVLNDVTQLKELDRIKSEMVRMTSHDLKNPLQAALANLDLLRDDVTDTETPQAEITQSLDNIERQLNRMSRIISGILDLERARMAAMPLEPCQPAQVMQVVMDEMSGQAQDRQIKLLSHVAADMPYFWGNERYFERALVNLVENAIKFTPQGGRVDVAADVRDGDVVFSVRDTGIGIPAEMQSKIFDRFFRVNQMGAEHITGSGLGLNLVKTVIDNHGGRIDVESHLDAGTTFTIFVKAVTDEHIADNHSALA